MAKGRRHHAISFVGFVLAVLCITLLLPREGKFKFEYMQGKPWLHPDLQAPFDFPILKSPTEFNAEKQQIQQNARLYFVKDTAVLSALKISFSKQLQTELTAYASRLSEAYPGAQQNEDLKTSFFEKYTTLGLAYFDSIHQRGIVASNAAYTAKPRETIVSVFVNQNEYEDYFLGDFYAPEQSSTELKQRSAHADSITQQIVVPVLMAHLKPTIIYNDSLTQLFLNDLLSTIPDTKGLFLKGKPIINRGEMVTTEKYFLLESLRKEYELQRGGLANDYGVVVGQLLFVAVIMAFLYFFLVLFRKQVIRSYPKTFSILALVVLTIAGTRLAFEFKEASIFIVPFTILPILLRSFYDSRLALFGHITATLIAAYLAPNSYEFVVLQLTAGMTAIFSFLNFRKRSQLFATVALVFSTYVLLYLSLTLIKQGTLLGMPPKIFLWFFISCFTALFSFPLIYIFEKVFGLFSDLTLLELSDTNTPLLRELSTKSPGTFQHAIQVANLAEAAIEDIGGNSLLVRTGALYHDIGKMIEPQYFIENQVSGINPHDQLSFEESARKIIMHVQFGVELARRYKLPNVIIDFIRTHHGTQTVQYFYKNYIKSFPDAPVDKRLFSYPGPIPFTKETAVLMMADAVEASSRSIHQPDFTKISELVDRIIDHQIQEQQFIHADITLKDIYRIRKIFKAKLLNMYHIRIEYPE